MQADNIHRTYSPHIEAYVLRSRRTTTTNGQRSPLGTLKLRDRRNTRINGEQHGLTRHCIAAAVYTLPRDVGVDKRLFRYRYQQNRLSRTAIVNTTLGLRWEPVTIMDRNVAYLVGLLGLAGEFGL